MRTFITQLADSWFLSSVVSFFALLFYFLTGVDLKTALVGATFYAPFFGFVLSLALTFVDELLPPPTKENY